MLARSLKNLVNEETIFLLFIGCRHAACAKFPGLMKEGAAQSECGRPLTVYNKDRSL